MVNLPPLDILFIKDNIYEKCETTFSKRLKAMTVEEIASILLLLAYANRKNR